MLQATHEPYSVPVCQDSASLNAGSHSGERGFAMLIVLWIIASASILVAAFNLSARSGTQLMSSELALSKARSAIHGGLEIAAAHLIDSTQDERWLPDGKSKLVRFAGYDLAITISDPNALLDINKASPELLKGFFVWATNSQQRATQIVEGIVRARQSANQARGAVQSDDSEPSDQFPTFIDVTQIRDIDGMNDQLFRKVERFLTVYSFDGRINPKTAPDNILSIIPELTPAEIERLRLQTAEQINTNMADVSEAAFSSITGDFGPAYTVTIVARKGREFQMGHIYTILPDLDKAAPYRLITRRIYDSPRQNRQEAKP